MVAFVIFVARLDRLVESLAERLLRRLPALAQRLLFAGGVLRGRARVGRRWLRALFGLTVTG